MMTRSVRWVWIFGVLWFGAACEGNDASSDNSGGSGGDAGAGAGRGGSSGKGGKGGSGGEGAKGGSAGVSGAGDGGSAGSGKGGIGGAGDGGMGGAGSGGMGGAGAGGLGGAGEGGVGGAPDCDHDVMPGATCPEGCTPLKALQVNTEEQCTYGEPIIVACYEDEDQGCTQDGVCVRRLRDGELLEGLGSSCFARMPDAWEFCDVPDTSFPSCT